MKDFLDGVMIAAPCDIDWQNMHGDERVRFCHLCKLNVYNTSSMTKSEIRDLLSQEGPLPCLRIYRRVDGTLLTADCPVGLRRIRSGMLALWRGLAALFALLFCAGKAAAHEDLNLERGKLGSFRLGGIAFVNPEAAPGKVSNGYSRPRFIWDHSSGSRSSFYSGPVGSVSRERWGRLGRGVSPSIFSRPGQVPKTTDSRSKANSLRAQTDARSYANNQSLQLLSNARIEAQHGYNLDANRHYKACLQAIESSDHDPVFRDFVLHEYLTFLQSTGQNEMARDIAARILRNRSTKLQTRHRK